MKKILVIGSSNVDTTLHVKDFPKPGETINALDVTQAAGGKGANQAVAAAKSGADTKFISRIGEDEAGNFMLKQLKSYGVSTDFVQTTPDQNTGHAFITLNEAGQNDIIIDHGANYQLSPSDVEAASDLFDEADCIIAQFETPLEATIAAFKLAKKKQMLTILNPAPAIKEVPGELLEYTDLIVPNETESAVLTGIEIKDEDDLVKNSQKLHELGVKNVIITYGDQGSFISTSTVQKLVPAFKVKAVDTTAAGDTFIGYFASKLDKDQANFEEAAVYASKASSITVQRLGAQAAIPTASEVKDAMEN